MSERFVVRQDPDRVPTRSVVIVAVVVVLVTVFASAVPAWILERRGWFRLDAPARLDEAPVAPREIDVVDQTLLEGGDAVAGSSRSAERARLERYGWVDRQAGVVHIPIERAMELVVEEEAASTAPVDAGGAP